MGMSKKEKAVEEIVRGVMLNDVAQVASGVALLVEGPLGGIVTRHINLLIAEQRAKVECYIVLEVLPTAPDEVVEAAYRALAKRCHPDKGGSKEAMARLNKAYEQIRKQRRQS